MHNFKDFMTVLCYTLVAGGGGFSSKPETHFAANIFIEDLLKLRQKPYKTIDKMVVSIHYK